MAVARVPTIMPHVSNSGGGDDLGSEDEVKVFKDEGEEEKRSSENLTEDKSDLIDLTESEVRIHFLRCTADLFPFFSIVFRVSRFAIYSSHTLPNISVATTRTQSIKCVHVCCRKRARSPVGPMRRREKRRQDPTSVPFLVSLVHFSPNPPSLIIQPSTTEMFSWPFLLRLLCVRFLYFVHNRRCPRENVKKVTRRGELALGIS